MVGFALSLSAGKSSGGGAALADAATKITFTEPWSGNIAFASVDVFVAAAATLDAIPNGTVAVHFNFGRMLVNAAHMGSMEWFRVPISVYDGLTAAAGGDTVTVATARAGRDFPAATATGSFSGRDLYIGIDAAGKPIFAGGSTTRGGAPATIIYEIHESVSSAESTGVGGGVDAWIDPKDTYEDTDSEKFLVENAVIKRVDTEYHAGHGKTIGGTASPGTWIELGSSGDEGGGAGAHFRGWLNRANQVANPSQGDFFCSALYGDFESYHDITSGTSGWRAYNPFAAGNYWDEVVNAAGDTVPVSSRGYYQANSIEHAFNEADETGDAFTIHVDRRIVVSEEVVAATADDTEYKPKTYFPPGTEDRGVSGWINPKAVYTADDLHKHLIENGVEKEVIVDFHAGHTRVTTMQVLADIGTALAADGTPHTADALGNFRGWFRRPTDIPNADRVDGSWYCARGIGDFEIQDPTNLHATERWNNYNPFESGGPWEEVTDANGDTIAQVAYADEDGNINDWRIVDTLFDAENGVTAVGQCFVVLSTYEVLMCVAYTAHAAESADYRAITYIPPGTVKSIVRFWGKDQTEAWPQSLLVKVITAPYRLDFEGGTGGIPNEILRGVDTGIKLLALADYPASTIDSFNTTLPADRSRSRSINRRQSILSSTR